MGVDVLTKCIHLENESKDKFYGAVSFPIFQTATFAHPSVGNSTGYDYSRLQNPTQNPAISLYNQTWQIGLMKNQPEKGLSSISCSLTILGTKN